MTQSVEVSSCGVKVGMRRHASSTQRPSGESSTPASPNRPKSGRRGATVSVTM